MRPSYAINTEVGTKSPAPAKVQGCTMAGDFPNLGRGRTVGATSVSPMIFLNAWCLANP